jgi:hypothetical protein
MSQADVQDTSTFTGSGSNASFKRNIIACILAGIILGKFTVISSYTAAFCALGLVLFLSVARSPLKAVSLLIFLIPFTQTTILLTPLTKLPGAKPSNLLGLFVLSVAILNYKQSAKIPKYSLVFITLFLGIFTSSIVRSLLNLDVINSMAEIQGGVIVSSTTFMLSHFVKPLIYFIPFVIVSKFVKTAKDIRFITNAIVLSVVTLSVYLLYIYFFNIGAKADVRAASEYYGLALGMHRNDLADFYIVAFPMALATYYSRKNVINLLSLCLIVPTVGFLYCRTAYVIVPLSFALYLAISKRAKWLPIFLAIAFTCSLVVSSTIVDRASKGVQSHDWNEISSGRIGGLWLPLLEECTSHPLKLLLGDGRYSIVRTDAAATGTILEYVGHPHNMYLEQLLDVGILGLVGIMWFFVLLAIKTYKGFKIAQDPGLKEYQCGVAVSLISYFVAGITGRSLFPTFSNSHFWVVVAIAIFIAGSTTDIKECGT